MERLPANSQTDSSSSSISLPELVKIADKITDIRGISKIKEVLGLGLVHEKSS